jgi:endogenous inhibitor of DNA gyrase (YacG/DUF329 family)
MCRKPVQLTDPFLPFCSERCKLIDLGNWSSGKYVISSPLKPGEEPGAVSEDEFDE